MSRSLLAVFGTALLVSAGLWLSMCAARMGHLELLPAHSVRRIRWWQGHARYVQIGCALVALSAVCLQIGTAGS